MKSLSSILVTLIVLSFLVAAAASLSAQAVGNTAGTKENLDLPYDPVGGDDPGDCSPEVIEFFGQTYEGDGFFLALDDLESTGCSGGLGLAKREVVRSISEFSGKVEFGIVFFDGEVKRFPANGEPAEATPPMKKAAIAWVQGLPGSSGTCLQQGIIAALEIANKASVKRKTLIYVGDGGGTCHGANESDYLKQTLGVVKGQNYQHAQINTIGVLMQGRELQRNFLRQLAQMNSGRYTEISH